MWAARLRHDGGVALARLTASDKERAKPARAGRKGASARAKAPSGDVVPLKVAPFKAHAQTPAVPATRSAGDDVFAKLHKISDTFASLMGDRLGSSLVEGTACMSGQSTMRGPCSAFR